MRLWSGLIAGLVACFACAAGAAEIKAPRQSFAQVDWPAALKSLSDAGTPSPMTARLRLARHRTVPAALARLNNVMAQHFPGLAMSPVPVLLPFDVEAMLRDQAAGTAASSDEQYLSGFHTARFFNPGPAGYDAAFAIKASDIAELSDSKFSDPIDVQISGSSLLYELDTPNAIEGQPVAALEPLYPGIRKLILEHNLRYTFVRFGVPYVVSITCFDAGVSRYHLPTCRSADVVAQRFLRALHVVGGMPRNLHAAPALAVERPSEPSHIFGYYGPGQLLPGTGFRDQGGRVDYTVYSQIRFPLAEAPASAGSELFQRRSRAWEAEEQANPSLIAEIRWRDNFCERRGFPVGQCPAGIGHQGQDIRPAPCKPAPGADRCTVQAKVVAARDGVILRSPQREAAYLVVNSANEHIRFRYLHMSPSKMDADNLLSGRRVHEGEVIGQVGNFSGRGNGTSYHLHFDIQVPTKDGWVFVNPYMTLVTAYERLIGARGTELSDAKVVVATADPAVTTGSLAAPARIEPDKPRHQRVSRHSPHKTKARRHARAAERESEQQPVVGQVHAQE
jgi:murein DD-endopeptidase MepM/ murein hydrolase activator NlpD